MSRELRIFLITLAGVALLTVGVTLALPDRWEVRSSMVLPAPPARVLPLVNDFEAWAKWSPMMSMGRTDTKVTVSGAAGEPGQELSWQLGPSEAVLRLEQVDGRGVEYAFYSRLARDGDLIEYGKGSIRVTPQGDGSQVEWVDRAVLPSGLIGYLQRWFVWFGVQQKSVQEVQQSGLGRLRAELEAR